jgi:hypothetical protein
MTGRPASRGKSWPVAPHAGEPGRFGLAPRKQMGVQISRGVHSQVSQEDVVRGAATASGRSVPKVGRAEGEQNRGGPSPSRSRSHVDLDPAKICGVAGDRIHQGKERNPLGSCIRRKETKLRRPALLGERVLRIHSWAGHRSDTDYIRKQEEEDMRLEQMNLWR